MTRYGAFVLTSVALISACESPAEPFDPSREEGDGVLGAWVHSGTYNRTYHLHTPSGMVEDGSYPLLIVLHGAGDTGSGFHARIDPDRETDAAGFITVFPDGLERSWTVGCPGCTAAEARGARDVAFLGTLIRHLAEGLPVDTARVYVVGFSQGGQLAQLFGCRSELPPAGIASVGGLLVRDVAQDCRPAAPFSAFFVQGDRDPVMNYHGFGAAARILSFPDTVERWLSALACDSEPAELRTPDRMGDGTTVLHQRYGGCESGGPVEVLTVEGGGHTWPGKTGPWPRFTGRHSRNLDATSAMLAFFSGG
jgi:polyhydroxybutyrate depolymerase